MVDIIGIFILFNPLKLLSAKQEVTGNVQRISKSTLILGKRDEACGRVKAGILGKET